MGFDENEDMSLDNDKENFEVLLNELKAEAVRSKTPR
jgi:hypothetical protein